MWEDANGPSSAPWSGFILLTSARRSEAADITWAEIIGADWTLPAARNKTKIDLVRPLPAAALAVLPPRVCDFVFTTDGATPISGYSKFKQAQTEPAASRNGPCMTCDGRHGALMSRVGVNTDIAERCLGHVIGGVRGVYDRHEYHEERARAFEALAGTDRSDREPAAECGADARPAVKTTIEVSHEYNAVFVAVARLLLTHRLNGYRMALNTSAHLSVPDFNIGRAEPAIDHRFRTDE